MIIFFFLLVFSIFSFSVESFAAAKDRPPLHEARPGSAGAAHEQEGKWTTIFDFRNKEQVWEFARGAIQEGRINWKHIEEGHFPEAAKHVVNPSYFKTDDKDALVRLFLSSLVSSHRILSSLINSDGRLEIIALSSLSLGYSKGDVVKTMKFVFDISRVKTSEDLNKGFLVTAYPILLKK